MRRSLLITLLALTLSGLALASQSLTCTGVPLAPQLSCFYESPSLTLGALELTTGAYLVIPDREWLVHPNANSIVDFAPYVTIAEYQPTWAWWVELRMPKIGGVPAVFGITDPIRVGFTYRW